MFIYKNQFPLLMAKNSTFLPSSGAAGGLISGFTSEHRTKFQFGPKVVIVFSLIVVFLIFLAFQVNFTF